MKQIKYILLFLVATFAMTACVRNYDIDDEIIVKPVFEPEDDATLVTVADLREMIGDQSSMAITEDKKYLVARVTGTDVTGNIYKKMYVQDETGGIDIEIDQAGIYKDYAVGQELYIDISGLYVFKYGGELELVEAVSGDQGTRIEYNNFKKRANRNGWPQAELVSPKVVTDFSSFTDKDVFVFVRLEGVRFENAGKNPFSDPDRTTNENMVDANGNTLVLRTSNYADFAKKIPPTGTGSVTGILGRYNNTWQFTIRSLDDLEGFDPIQDPDPNKDSEGNTFIDGVAQLPYTESFEKSIGHYTIENVGTLPSGLNFVWEWSSQYKCMKGTAYVNSKNYASESWIISPLVNLKEAQTATLKFQHAGRYFNGNMSTACTLWARTEGGEWTQLSVDVYSDESSFTFYDATASLADFVGNNVQVGFKYTSTSSRAGTWEVKNVTIE